VRVAYNSDVSSVFLLEATRQGELSQKKKDLVGGR
jgi:hypothetical protein